MGDNRPIAYREGDNLIFRASSLGRDPRCFVAALREYEPLPAPQYLIDAAEAGNRFEPIVKDMMRDEGYEISGEQGVLEWTVDDGLIVRGHLDAETCVFGGEDRLLEVKSMSDRRFSSWLKHGFEKMPSYAWQLSAYMHVTGKKATYAVINRDTNELHISDVDELLVPEVTMRRKILLVRYYYQKGEFPKCDSASEYMCPYEYMCDRLPTMFEEIESGTEEMLIRLAQEYDQVRKLEQELKAKKGSIRADMLEALGDRERVKAGTWSIVKSVSSREKFNKQAARMELGDEVLSEFYEEYDVMQLRVKETG
jgi:hypothetical protein